jgi:hypothetical protein
MKIYYFIKIFCSYFNSSIVLILCANSPILYINGDERGEEKRSGQERCYIIWQVIRQTKRQKHIE